MSCPIESTVSEGFAPSSETAILDDDALKGVIGSDVKATVILIRRVKGVPIYRYLSNGTSNDIFQPWSSSKFIAAAAAASELRAKSGGKVGLTGNVGDIPLGDLVTVIASYREDDYSSNGLARYFLNVAGRPEVKALVHDWLKRPTAESLGGNYGVPAPGLGYEFTDSGGASVTITPDDREGISNALSSRTLAEFMKRLVVWDDASTRLAHLQEADVQTLMYGAIASKWWPGDPWGGLSADVALPVDKALDLAKVESESKGRWRIFGKVGWGNTAARGYERVNVSYACLPVLDAAGKPQRDKGAEFVIATKTVTPSSHGDTVALVNASFKKIINDVVLKQAQTEGPFTKDGFPPGEQGGPDDPNPGDDPGSDPPGNAAKKAGTGSTDPSSAESDGEAVGCSVRTGKKDSMLSPLVVGLISTLIRRQRRNRGKASP